MGILFRVPVVALWLFAALAAVAGLALGAHARWRARRPARPPDRVDALTQLFDRRRFDEQVELAFARAQRLGEPLALLLVDIDGFRSFNARYGEERGDAVLRGVARQLTGGVRTQGVVYRFGGEDFAVILPRTDGAAATVLAGTLRAAIASGTGIGSGVTVSIGVASPADGGIADVRRLLQAAGAALYQAKANGRNRVERHHGGVSLTDVG